VDIGEALEQIAGDLLASSKLALIDEVDGGVWKRRRVVLRVNRARLSAISTSMLSHGAAATRSGGLLLLEQQCLYFLPAADGQGSLRLILAISGL